nr:immunoglobulin heavy chain junction region [Macaca mulatta]MOW19392.1 immunoglobulin heavy chain junction region [Macaca mulatta]MOW19915.1 immunoglobulin heavy chain junction region [Macaca mulatta]MOW19951.1 immunoglobulin heavy chain junction region [Macaca mulatta]MOW20933.1 immunoglobulin heavy chain junction region [Macaca mulatta]
CAKQDYGTPWGYLDVW